MGIFELHFTSSTSSVIVFIVGMSKPLIDINDVRTFKVLLAKLWSPSPEVGS